MPETKRQRGTVTHYGPRRDKGTVTHSRKKRGICSYPWPEREELSHTRPEIERQETVTHRVSERERLRREPSLTERGKERNCQTLYHCETKRKEFSHIRPEWERNCQTLDHREKERKFPILGQSGEIRRQMSHTSPEIERKETVTHWTSEREREPDKERNCHTLDHREKKKGIFPY